MSVYVGESHSAALGLGGIQDASVEGGRFEGQEVTLHGESKSMLELAYEMDDCPTDARVNRDHLIKRDIKDKKKATEKRKLLSKYVDRLDKTRGSQQYVDYEQRMNRLKRQAMMQNGQSGTYGDNLSFDGEDLAEYILRNISSSFDEVTEQDNALAYLNESEDFDEKSLNEQLAVCQKMLLRLEGCSDEKSIIRRNEFKSKINSLNDEIAFSKSYKKSLERALSMLEDTHGQEIKDGYNIIPKAVDMMIGHGGADKVLSASELAIFYRDKVLCSDNVFDVIASIVEITEANSTNPMIYSRRENDERHTVSNSMSSAHAIRNQ